MSDPRANNVLVETLGTSLRYGGSALSDVPELLKRVLSEDAWRTFETRQGEVVRHERFGDFVASAPLRGLGADRPLVDRIAGTGDPDLLRLLREAWKVGQGSRSDLRQPPCESHGGYDGGTDYAAERLAREAPDEYQAVQRGERSINAAAVRAGIRRHRIPIRLDSAESAARTLRDHMPPDTRRALARLLLDD